MSRNTRNKRRTISDPYEKYVAYIDGVGEVTWAVLKHYASPEREKSSPFARVFCAAKSPATGGSWEYGDVYCAAIPNYDYDAQEEETQNGN